MKKHQLKKMIGVFFILSIILTILIIMFNNLNNQDEYIKDKIQTSNIVNNQKIFNTINKKQNDNIEYGKSLIKKIINKNKNKYQNNQKILVSNTYCLIMLNEQNHVVKQNNKKLCPSYKEIINNYNNIVDITKYLHGNKKDVLAIDYNGLNIRKKEIFEVYNKEIENGKLISFNDDYGFSFQLKTDVNNNINKFLYKIPTNSIVKFDNKLYTFKRLNEFFSLPGNLNYKIIVLSKYIENKNNLIRTENLLLLNSINNNYFQKENKIE
jgi:hypothetical protein